MDFGERAELQCDIDAIPHPEAVPPLSLRVGNWLRGGSTEAHKDLALAYTLRYVVRVVDGNPSEPVPTPIIRALAAAGARAKLRLRSRETSVTWETPLDEGASSWPDMSFTIMDQVLSAAQLGGSTLHLALTVEESENLAGVEVLPVLVGGGWRP
jgi:hypothetical protein